MIQASNPKYRVLDLYVNCTYYYHADTGHDMWSFTFSYIWQWLNTTNFIQIIQANNFKYRFIHLSVNSIYIHVFTCIAYNYNADNDHNMCKMMVRFTIYNQLYHNAQFSNLALVYFHLNVLYNIHHYTHQQCHFKANYYLKIVHFVYLLYIHPQSVLLWKKSSFLRYSFHIIYKFEIIC